MKKNSKPNETRDNSVSTDETVPERVNRITFLFCTRIGELYNFRAHTILAFDFFSENHNLKEAGMFHTEFSGESYRKKELIRIFPGYKDHYLPTLVLQQLANLMENFLNEVLQEFLRANPKALDGSKKLAVADVLEESDMDKLLDTLVEKEVYRLFYKSLGDVFEYIGKRTNIKLEDKTISQLEEIRACRDIIVHNGGIANSMYLQKAGEIARVADGERLPIDCAYLERCFELVKNMVSEMGKKLFEKMGGKDWKDFFKVETMPGFVTEKREAPRKIEGDTETVLSKLKYEFRKVAFYDECKMTLFRHCEKQLLLGIEPFPKLDPLMRDYVEAWGKANDLEILWKVSKESPTMYKD